MILKKKTETVIQHLPLFFCLCNDDDDDDFFPMQFTDFQWFLMSLSHAAADKNVERMKLIRLGSQSFLISPFLLSAVAYKITFNTIDNLIWKPQQTNTKGERRGGWWKRIIEPCSGLQLLFVRFMEIPSLCYYFAYTFQRDSLSLLHYFRLLSLFRFPFAREEKCFPIIPPVCLWSVKGRSNKCLLRLAVKLYSLLFYQTNT